jgi:excisionase family DNA binding protein
MKHVGSKKTGIARTESMILTVQELAERLRVHPTTIYRLLAAKKIPGFRVGGDWRFNSDAIDRWCAQALVVGPPPR